MKYRIEYREYGDTYDIDQGSLAEFFSTVEADFFEIKNGFCQIWTEDNDTTTPDFYINANDVLTIKRIA